MPYICPLCKTEFKLYKWYMNHKSKYPEEEKKKIFVIDKRIYFQGQLYKYIDDKDEDLSNEKSEEIE